MSTHRGLSSSSVLIILLAGCSAQKPQGSGEPDGGAPDSISCTRPLSECSEACVDFRTDEAHCGGCDRACTTSQSCRAGNCVVLPVAPCPAESCQPPCPSGFDLCGETCCPLPVWEGIPAERVGHAMVFDSTRNRVVLFGGETNQQPLNDTWEYDGNTHRWHLVSVAQAPPARRWHSMVYDAARQRIVLFGGFNKTFLNDTWEYDAANTTWEKVENGTAPTARYWHAMAYIPETNKVILFGGLNSGFQSLQDTWEFDGTTSTWSRLATPSSPSSRSGHAMAYFAQTRRLILFGGATDNGTRQNDTWAFDVLLKNWSLVSTSNAPSGRRNHAMAYDAQRGRIVSLGGENGAVRLFGTWEFDDTSSSWTLRSFTQSPTARKMPALVYDSARQRLVAFGGDDVSGLRNDTWEWDGSSTAWQPKSRATVPPLRTSHAMVYDASAQRMVLFGGENEKFMNDTWLYDGQQSQWTQSLVTDSPSARRWHAMAYDSDRQVTVLFGGFASNFQAQQDTWEFNARTDVWTARSPTTPPPPRVGHVMVYDAGRGRMVLFGGLDDSFLPLDDTWEYNATANQWTKVNVTVSPPGRSVHGMVFDSSRQKVILFGGFGKEAQLNDTWEYDGNAARWTRLTTETAPSERSGHSLAYDSKRDVTLLFGGAGVDYLDDTWELDGQSARWKRRDITHRPKGRFSSALAFDSDREAFLLFGGRGPKGPLNDTWELLPP